MSYYCLRSSELKIVDEYQNCLCFIESRSEVIDFSLLFIRKVIQCDFVGWNRMHHRKIEFLDARIYPSLGSVLPVIAEPITRTLDTHWMFHHYYAISPNSFETAQITDLVSHRQFLESAIYREAYRHFDATYQLHLQIPDGGASRVIYNITRKSLEFTDREKKLLDLLGRQTHRRLTELPRLLPNDTMMNHFYDAFDSETEGLIRLNSDFSVCDIYPSAKRLAKFFFPDYTGGKTLPVEVRDWINRGYVRNGIENVRVSIKKTTTFNRWGRVLIAILLKKPNEEHSILVFQEDQTALDEYNRITKMMTRRQRQVFHLLKDGVTDLNDISNKLNISARTAEGHRRNVHSIIEKT